MGIILRMEEKVGKILDLNKAVKKGIWCLCFKCRAKLKGRERKYGFCRKCFYDIGVRDVTGQ